MIAEEAGLPRAALAVESVYLIEFEAVLDLIPF